jgi:hypothetical protein
MADKNTKWKQKDIEWYEVPTITGQKRYKVSTRNSKSMWHSDANVVVVQLIGGLIAMIYLIYTL